MSIQCKKCKSSTYVKNGIVREEQRYKCKTCGCNFIGIDRRKREKNDPLRIMCILIYSLGKGTYRFLGQLFGVAHTTVYRWIRKEAYKLPEPDIPLDITDVEIDEMWHFLHQKKTRDGS